MLRCVLSGGDDYELVFTAPEASRDLVAAAALACDTPVTRIGSIQVGRDLQLLDESGADMPNTFRSFDHFA
jgi:thiamine-monophosphate kinase